MSRQPANTVVPLRLHAPIKFRDRWQGRLTAMEVDEGWEVLNLIVRRGLLRWATSVKLPLSASSAWSEECIEFDCTSRQAFAREIPPVAAPARPVSGDTPVSLPGATLAGLLVEPGRRLATQVIIGRGVGRRYRVPVSDVSFEGKVMHVTAHGDKLHVYLSDDELAERARDLLRSASVLGGEERRTVSAHASGGLVTVTGNVRTKHTRELIEELMPRLQESAEIRTELVDDVTLELAIGRAIEHAGLQRTGDVYARSLLGEVTFFGRAPAADAINEIVRVVSRVPGVRSVMSRMETGAVAAAR